MYDLREELFERDEEDDSFLQPKRASSSIRSAEISSKKETDLSYTTVKLRSSFDDDDEEIYFPSYDSDHKYSYDNLAQLLPQPSKRIEFLVEAPQPVSSPSISEMDERPEDDTAVRVQPSRHVDYLSHEWSEEEVWSSYKLIVSKRKTIPNSERLENASWRSWEKRRRNLKTVSCESVKWLKDHDVTWLYGPLQPSLYNEDQKCNSSADFQYYSGTIKPILKKPSLSQQMLQSSLSSASLRRESAGQVKAQTPRRNSYSLNNCFTSASQVLQSKTSGSESGSRSLSPDQLPWNSKNVRFHEVVVQCIVNSGEDETCENIISEPDEEVVMMRRPVKPDLKKALPEKKKTQESPLPQTISKLPDASLKCSEDENEADENVVGLGIWQGPTVLTPGPSWHNKLNGDEEDEDDESDEEEEEWEPPKWLHKRKDSMQIFHDKLVSIRMHCETEGANQLPLQRPNLERREEAVKEDIHVAKAPVIKDHDSTVVFDLPPCRSQLDAFSFSSKIELQGDTPSEERLEFSPRSQDYFAAARRSNVDMDDFFEEDAEVSPALNLAKTAMVNRIMDEFWVVYNDMEKGTSVDSYHRDVLLPDVVRKHLESLVCNWRDPDEEEIIEDLLSIIHSCRDQLTPHLSSQSGDQDRHLTESPHLSSDSGYGSEETEKVRVVIRDTNTALIEKEKGVQDWDLYPEAWDEDEAVAWERGY